MSEEKKKLTPSNAVVKIATEIVRQQIANQPAEKSLVPAPIDPIDSELLKELLDATNELYYTRCIL